MCSCVACSQLHMNITVSVKSPWDCWWCCSSGSDSSDPMTSFHRRCKEGVVNWSITLRPSKESPKALLQLYVLQKPFLYGPLVTHRTCLVWPSAMSTSVCVSSASIHRWRNRSQDRKVSGLRERVTRVLWGLCDQLIYSIFRPE